MASEKTPVVWDDDAKKHRPLGSGEKMGGLSASSMISSDSGNLLQQGSDGLMLVTGSSLADPRADNLLEESANGKLQVTSDRVVEWLEGHPQAAAALAEAVKVVSEDSGNVITAGTDKGAFMSKNTLASAVSTMSAAQLTTLANALRKQGGGLSVGSDGKLSVDFGSMDPSIMRNVVLSMVQQGGGIGVDSSGKLFVDFDSMPTDKFEAMMATLHMQIPLEANLTLHVDDNSDGDSIVDGRGTAAKPFKTIGGCITWAAGYYSLGRFSITVLVHPGTYDESITCPSYNASSGVFTVAAFDQAQPPVIRRDDGARTNMVVSGGTWNLTRLKFVNHPVDQGGSRNWYPYCLSAANAAVYLRGCEFEMEYDGAQTSRVRMFVISSQTNATVDFVTMPSYPSKLKYNVGDAAYLYVLSAESGGRIVFSGTFDESHELRVLCRGAASRFASSIGTGSGMTPIGSGDRRLYFTTESGQTCSGTKYYAADGGSIRAPEGGFPGTADSGYVDSSTFSWYKEEGA